MVGLEALGLVDRHDLDGLALALDALDVAVLGVGNDEPFGEGRQRAHQLAERDGLTFRAGPEDLAQVQRVREAPRAPAREQLALGDAAVVEDALEEAGPVAGVGERPPPGEPLLERVAVRIGRERREIGEREAEERREPRAQALRGLARIVDGGEQVAHLARLRRAEEPLLVVKDVGDARLAQRARDLHALDARAREDEDLVERRR